MLHKVPLRRWIIALLCVPILLSNDAFADATPLAVPGMPTNVQASDGTYDTKIRVTWGVVSGATYYYVDRGTKPTWTGSGVVNAETAPPFDDFYSEPLGPVANMTYYY